MLKDKFVLNLVITCVVISLGILGIVVGNQHLTVNGVNMFMMFVAFGLGILALSRFLVKNNFDGSRGAFTITLMWVVYSIIWRDPSGTVEAVWGKLLHDVMLFMFALFRLDLFFRFPKPYEKIKNAVAMIGFTLVATIPLDDNSLTIISGMNAGIRTACALLVFITCEAAKPFIVKSFRIWEECVMLLMGFLYFASVYSVCLSSIFLVIIIVKIYKNDQIRDNLIRKFSAITKQMNQFELIGEDDILIYGADLDKVPSKEEIQVINDDAAPEHKDEHFLVINQPEQNGYHEKSTPQEIEHIVEPPASEAQDTGFSLVYFEEDDYTGNESMFKSLISEEDEKLLNGMSDF